MPIQERWIKWQPAPMLVPTYYIEVASDKITEFILVMSNANNRQQKVTIEFDKGIGAYKKTNPLLITYCDDTKRDEAWAFFKVDNSAYIQWLYDESYTISETRHFMHFAFVGINSVIEVAASYNPLIELK